MEGLKTEVIEIDGVEYSTTQFAAMRAMRILAMLIKVAGPAIGALAGAKRDAQLTAVMPELQRAFATMDPGEFESLALSLLSGTSATIQGPQGPRRVEFTSAKVVDQVFSGRLGTMFKVIAHAVKVNYGDFAEGSDPDESLPKDTDEA